MASRAFVVRYFEPRVQLDGNINITIETVYVDPAVPNSGVVMGPNVDLISATPAGWDAQIKNAVVAVGVTGGFPDLVSTAVFIPTYA